MRFTFSKDLLILLISLFILSSCKNPEGVGLEVLDDDSMNIGTTATLAINTHAAQDDSIVGSTTAFVSYLAGNFQDPVFGNSQANLVVQLLLSKSNVSFGTGATLDSAVLVLSYVSDTANRFYGDGSSVVKIKVHELKESLSPDTVYYSNRSFNYDLDTLATMDYRINHRDSLVIQNIIKGKKDTFQRVRPQVRIRIDKLGQRLLDQSGTANLGDNDAFLKYLNGLYITAERVSGDGGMMNFDLSTSTGTSGVILYYKSGTDTTNFVLNINSSSIRTRQFKHDYTGSPVGQQLSDTSLGQQTVYLSPMGGIRTKVDFPDLRHLYDSGLVTLNKAELVLQIEPGTDASFAAATGIAMVGINEDGDRIAINTVSYNSSTKQYKIDITRPLQDILNDKLKLKAMYIECGNKPIRANRSIIGGPKSVTAQMYLKVVYTKLY